MKRINPITSLLPFWLFAFFFKFGAGLHYTLLPILGERILPIWIVGIIIGASSFVQLAMDVPAGFALDRWGYTRLLRIATFVFIIGGFVLLLWNLSVPVFLITVILGLVGWLFFSPGVDAYTLAYADEGEGGRYMGINHAFCSLGIVFAAMVTSIVFSNSSKIMGFIIASILVCALIAILVTRKENTSVHTRRHFRQSYYIRRHFLTKTLAALKRLNPASTLLAIQNLSGSIFYAMIWFTIPLVLANNKGSGILGVGLSVFDLAIVVLGAFLGRLADRSQKKSFILAGLLIFSVAGALIGFNLNVFFLVLGFIATSGDEMSSASLWSWLERLDKDHGEDGLVNGVIMLFGDLGWMLGPILAGLLFDSIGPSLTIVAGAVPIIVTWFVALFFLRGRSFPTLESIYSSPYKPILHRHKR